MYIVLDIESVYVCIKLLKAVNLCTAFGVKDVTNSASYIVATCFGNGM